MKMQDLGDLRELRNLSREDLLRAIGLETRRTAADYVLPALGIFSAGLLVGAGLGLLMAPKSGRDLRTDLGHRVTEMRHRGNGEIDQPTA